MRTEKDSLGAMTFRDDEYYGIETKRALRNFAISEKKIDPYFIKAYAAVKLACAFTNTELGYLSKDKGNAISIACEKILQGKYFDQIVVNPLQGGAGTSTNQNFNEVITNLALENLGYAKGRYDIIHPLHHVNLHQSTNDTFPTAVKVAILLYLKDLEKVISLLQAAFQKKEQAFKDIVKLGRTQLQDAVPMTLGMTFGSFSEAIARDRWRIFKNRERIKTFNLGGTAIGTGLNAPQKYIFRVGEKLRDITGLAISRSENLIDSTQNQDAFVEISGMLKAYASNLIKIANDLRLLASGPNGGIAEITLPTVQSGSTIMPGKVNPVIPEMVVQVGLKVIANDTLITQTAFMGQLELNHLFPLLADSLFDSLSLLQKTTQIFTEKCINGIKANKVNCKIQVENSQAIATILVSKYGYKKVESYIQKAKEEKVSIKTFLLKEQILSQKEFDFLLSPMNMYKLGFTDDINLS